MIEKIRDEYEMAVKKRDEIKAELESLESEKQKSHYNITITRDRLAYWEGKSEGLKFALDHLPQQ
ncbi:MAG: hypothetical protein AMK71_03160 [Nitrospira bacterium SG8_35_4]|nr:MAG: hypothetical protein AMK71_03160 [Nitrospira bacterium SG8_35_4]